MSKFLQTALFHYCRRFPIRRGKQRLVTALWRAAYGDETLQQTVLPRSGVRVECDLASYLPRLIYFMGEYEPELTRHWRKLAATATVAFDVGANTGLYSLLARSANPSIQVHAFEPASGPAAAFRRNAALNGFHDIRLNAQAVGRYGGRGFLHHTRGASGDNDAMDFLAAGAGVSGEAVEIVTLDNYCRRHQIDHINLMKLDVEGGEYDALASAAGLLDNGAIDIIFVELIEWAAARCGHSTADVIGLLRDAGFALYFPASGGTRRLAAEDDLAGSNVTAIADHFHR